MSSPDRPLGSPFRLKTFGGARIEGHDGSVVPALMQRRRLALLSLLAASEGGLSRDRIIGLLWAESEEDKARHVLAQLVHSLRRAIGDAGIEGDQTTLRLNPSVVSSDAQEFIEAIGTGKLEVAVDLYRGLFLDAFYLNECPDFERWTEERRAELARDVETALESLARQTEDPVQAVTWWRRLAAMRRLDSRIALLVAKAMARAGDRAGAIEHARIHAELLRQELEQAPSPELTAFVETLRVSPLPRAPKSAGPTSSAIANISGVESPTPDRRRWRSVAGVAAAVAGAIAATIGFRAYTVDSSPRWVIITDAINTTGDRAFDHTIPVALTAMLTQSPHVRIETPDRVTRALERMRRTGADSVIDEKLAREIAERDDIQVVAVPAVHRADQGFELSAKLLAGRTGEVLAFVSERAATRSDVLEALDRLGRQVRRELGESRGSVNANAVPLPRVTTTSLDALKRFADGNRAFDRSRLDEAGRLWAEAVALDSTFATAHSNLGMLTSWTNRPTASDTHYANALRHLGGLPDREQMLIRASSKRWRGDWAGSAQLLSEYAGQNPDDVEVQARLAYDYVRMGKSGDAIAALTRVLAVDSLDQGAWINLATAHIILGHTAESIQAFRRAFALSPATFSANDNVNLEFAAALVKGNLLDSARAVIKLLADHSNPILRARGLRSMSYLAAHAGRYAEAAAALAQANAALRSTTQLTTTTSELRNHLLRATVLTELGRTPEATRQLDSAYALVMATEIEATFVYWAGKALARAGDVGRAAALVAAIEKKARKDSPTDRIALAALRGETFVARGQPKEAIPHLDAAWAIDSGHPVVIESRAYVAEAAGDIELATSLYQRLADKTMFGNEGQYIWQMSAYRLAHLYERAGKRDHARVAYERFLTNWPRPDSGLGAVVDARARLRLLATK